MTLEYDNQKVHLRRFDLWETLAESEIDYVFVDSIPPSVAFRGQTLDYQMHARSSDSEVIYRLASGPEELSVSPAGKLVWRVPSDYVDASAQAIVVVSNSDGKETFHSFHVEVRDVVTEFAD
ncbi:MAG: hypothetical protein WD049_02805 [Candidatus Paceibacterota bacterium]